MDQKENKEEQFQAVIDGTENIKPKKKKEEKKGLKYELLDLVKTFVICFVCIFLLTNFVVKPVRVDGRSMDPTLEDGEIGLMNVFSAKFQDIERFDVVVVYNEEKKENWVKRVIGLPGDTIYAKDDVVYVNGMPIEEPYLDNDYADGIRLTENYKFTEDFDEVQLGEDEYYLMGDNRYASKDSREMGAFKRGDIKAVDFFIVLPFNKMRVAE